MHTNLIDSLSPITDRIYISSHKIANTSPLNGITHVISVNNKALTERTDLTYHRFGDLEDEKDPSKIDYVREKLIPVLASGCEIIHEILNRNKFNKVLVQCNAGKCRSVSLVIAYICKVTHLNYGQILSFVQSKRVCAKPNSNFETVIKEFLSTGRELNVTTSESEDLISQIY